MENIFVLESSSAIKGRRVVCPPQYLDMHSLSFGKNQKEETVHYLNHIV